MNEPYFLEQIESKTRRLLLEAALELFSERGLSGTGIRDIAERAGYTNPALYRHYKGKEALALDLFVRAYDWMAQRLWRAVESAGEPGAGLRRFIEAYAAIFDAHPELVVYLDENLHHFWPHVPEELKERTIVTASREALRAEAAAQASDSDRELRVVALLGTLSQLSRMIFLGGYPGPMGAQAPQLTAMLSRLEQ